MLICLSCSHIKICEKNCLRVIVISFLVSSSFDEYITARRLCIFTLWFKNGCGVGIRTCTLRFLRPFPLPVGIQEQFGDPRETRTRTCRIKSPVSYQLDERIIWSSQSDLNRQSSAYKAAALPLCYRSLMVSRVGIQPTFRSP